MKLPKVFVAHCRTYLDAKKQQSSHEKLARASKVVADASKNAILNVLDGAREASCGDYKLSVAPGQTLPATLTTGSGRSVNLSDIETVILTDGSKISGKEILTVFSGRNESDKLSIV